MSGLFGGEGGSSSSSQSTTTQQEDMRVVGGDASTNVSAHESTVNVTDAGAVHAAFDFAQGISEGAFTTAAASMHEAGAVEQQAMTKVADAYSTAKAGEQKILVGAALAIVGVVAFAAVKR